MAQYTTIIEIDFANGSNLKAAIKLANNIPGLQSYFDGIEELKGEYSPLSGGLWRKTQSRSEARSVWAFEGHFPTPYGISENELENLIKKLKEISIDIDVNAETHNINVDPYEYWIRTSAGSNVIETEYFEDDE